MLVRKLSLKMRIAGRVTSTSREEWVGSARRTASPGDVPASLSHPPAMPGASGSFQGVKGFRGISSPASGLRYSTVP